MMSNYVILDRRTYLEDDQLIVKVEYVMFHSGRGWGRDEVGRLRLILSDPSRRQHG